MVPDCSIPGEVMPAIASYSQSVSGIAAAADVSVTSV